MSTPDQLAVDLHDLWWAAHALRDMASAHTDAHGTVNGVSPSSALTRPEGIGLGTTGYYDSWSSLQDQITSMLTQNAKSLTDSATAMELCIKTYTDQDQAVAAAFEARKKAIPYE